MNPATPGERIHDNSEGPAARTAELLRDLVGNDAEVLTHDTVIPDEDEAAFSAPEELDETLPQKRIIGSRRELPVGGNGMSIGVGVYNDEARAYMADVIRDILGESLRLRDFGAPIGFLEFETPRQDGFGLDAVVYVFDGAVVALMNQSYDDENPVSATADRFLDAASSIGLGNVWAHGLMRFMRDDPRPSSEGLAVYDTWQITRLNATLEQALAK